MRVAIALFGDEVSPRFGSSARFMLATVENDRVQTQEIRDVSDVCPHDFPEFLSSVGVEKLICGGVHRRFRDELERRGIDVIWGVIGSAAEALAAYLGGRLQCDQFVCDESSGRHRCGHGRQSGQEGSPAHGGRKRGACRNRDRNCHRAAPLATSRPARAADEKEAGS